MIKNSILVFSLFALLFSTACNDIFGTKEDDTIKEIFEEGAIDPTLNPQNVGYVPIQPIWNGFVNPTDVYAGYDEMIYVIDDNGVHVLDQTGKEHRVIAVKGATDVVQDRRIHTYVIGTVDYEVNNEIKELSAIYRLGNTAGEGDVVYLDTIIHPFDDESRRNTSFRKEDEEVRFTGVAPMADNKIYVSRTGPRNDPNATSRPDNVVLVYDKEGNNTTFARGLSPDVSSLKSTIGISAIANEVGPPQEVFGISTSLNFAYCQQTSNGNVPEFGVLYITVTFNPESGYSYESSPVFTDFDYGKSSRFMYESFRFGKPEDICFAPDRRHIFVVDSEKDSLYQFTISGEEGVTPPANSTEKRNIIVSFGGEGDGPFQFKDPSGICYLRRTLFVADKGNGRIMRYRLNTDLE
ncbi:MAG: hypothetical protein ACPGLV_11855 [Bacteroidia bacterium]